MMAKDRAVSSVAHPTKSEFVFMCQIKCVMGFKLKTMIRLLTWFNLAYLLKQYACYTYLPRFPGVINCFRQQFKFSFYFTFERF